MGARTETDGTARPRYIVPITAMLAFISFWRAAAIVLADLGSSAYYAGGIAEQAVGKAAPWFILAIMLFSYAVRAVYIESCSMFVRGGVYRVVRAAMGGVAAKLSVSALLFDYTLTGPISAVSAGLYLAGLLNESAGYFGLAWPRAPGPSFAAGFAVLVTLYFWRTNRIGIPFSSAKALRIMQITTVMVVILIAWCLITVFTRGYQPVPPPAPENLSFSDEALGWLKGTAAPSIPFIAILIALGHSLLAMSGEESLAQVYREIEAPKLENLKRAGLTIFIYSLLFTSLVSFFSVMLIPDAERARYYDNLIGGLAIFLAGPASLKLAFHAFVVLVGMLILSGAVNTAIIGSNGVLNRVAEDGVLPQWFREPHARYGTTYRIINLIAALQLAAIVLSRGNVYRLGEAYAFGVVWSFALKALAVTVLRFKAPEAPRWKVPLNLRIGRTEIPLGLMAITATLFLLAVVNMLTKETATIWGVVFTAVLFAAFTASERRYGSRQTLPHEPLKEVGIERFRFEVRDDLSPESLRVREGNILFAARGPAGLGYLEQVLDETDTKKIDVVVLALDPAAAPEDGGPDGADDKVLVFSQAVHIAERLGKPVALAAAAGVDPHDAIDAMDAILATAEKLRSARLIVAASGDPAGEEWAIRRARARLG
ncbi:MAG TPA: APC family permease, partial [Candidatus Binatia bacterium]